MTKICSIPCRICRDAKIKIREIANVTFFDSKNVVQSKDIKTTIPKNTKNRPKYVRKMYLMRFYLFCLGDLVTRTGEQEIWSVSGRLPDNPGGLA